MRAGLIVAEFAGWPVLQLSIAWAVTRMDAKWFATDHALLRVRGWELWAYRRRRWWRWRSMLPDGGAWVGAFRKKRLLAHDSEYLHRFVVETRRAETAHWAMMACLPLFFGWNPAWACGVMAFYAVASNLPCIVAQRYNRAAILRVLSERPRVRGSGVGVLWDTGVAR